MLKHIFTNKKVLKECKIFNMLQKNIKNKHISFHTPGHKYGYWDITELSYSDNLSCPHGVLFDAERDISKILGSNRSFILTDGSTSGIYSILKASGIKKLLVPRLSHKSIFNGCNLLGITPIIIENNYIEQIPLQPTPDAIKDYISEVDGVILTSPDYYGNIADLKEIRNICDKNNKILLIDGAHGSHLHNDLNIYAGNYADLWVDGVHKNLPAMTQGAVVSSKNEFYSSKLADAVDIFRTTSPSYPIMASVEYAVKYPPNIALKRKVMRFIKSHPDRIYFGGDWTKLCVIFGDRAFEIHSQLENMGIFAEFCDGNIIMFYLSPATSLKDFNFLKTVIEKFLDYSFSIDKREISNKKINIVEGKTNWIKIDEAAGKICARTFGLFPPCTPLVLAGEEIDNKSLFLIQKADNVFGVKNGMICVYEKNPESNSKDEKLNIN